MDINNNQLINVFTGGMNTDTSDAMLNAEQYRYAENLRVVTNTEENSGELRLIEGNKLLHSFEGYDIIYLTSIREYVVVILKNKSNNTWNIQVNNNKGVGDFTKIFGDCSEAIWKDEVALSVVTRYESDNNIKMYIADNTGEHNIMLINIDKEHWPTTPATELKMISGFVQSNLNKPSAAISNDYGQLKPARVLYTYRLYRYGGAATQLSPLSNVVSLYKNKSEGYLYGETTSKSVSVSIDTTNSLNLNRILLYRITYEQVGQQPSCALVKDADISSTTITLLDTGTNLSTMSIEELLALDTISIKPKIIESKEDYLFAADINYETDDVDKLFEDVDLRAFSTGMYWNDGNKTYININSDGSLIIPEGYKDKEILHDQFNESGNQGYIEDAWYIPNTSTKGGRGKYITWEYDEKTVTVDTIDLVDKTGIRSFKHDETYRFGAVLYDNEGRKSSVKWIADIKIPNFTSSDVTVTENTDGSVSYTVKYYNIKFTINPIPNASAIQIVRCSRGINDSRVIATGIVGRPMQLYTGLSSSQLSGITASTIYGDDKFDKKIYEQTNMICPSGFMSLQDIYSRNVAGADDEKDRRLATSMSNVILFASPEYIYADEQIKDIISSYQDSILLRHNIAYNIKQSTDTFKNVQYYRMASNLYPNYGFRVRTQNNYPVIIKVGDLHGVDNVNIPWGDDQSTYVDDDVNRQKDGSNSVVLDLGDDQQLGFITFNHATLKETTTDVAIYGDIKRAAYPEVPDWNKFADGENIRYNDDVTVIGNYSYINWSYPLALSDPVGKSSWMASVLRAIDAQHTAFRNSTYYYPIGTGGKCILFELKQDVAVRSNNVVSPTYLYKGNLLPVHIADLVKPVNPYNGYNKRAIKDSVYYQYGDYSKLDSTVVMHVGSGDSTIGLFQYNANHNWYDANYTGATKMGTVYTFPVETNIDMLAQSGDLFSIKSSKGYYIQDKASTFRDYAQQKDAYIYNAAYGVEPQVMPQTTATYTDIDANDFDTRVHYSDVKTNGEWIDNWTRFKAANFTDVDTRHGQITNMRLFKDKLVFWQNNAVGVLRVNQRSVVQDMDGTQLILGNGGVLDGFDYLSTVYGMKKNQFADGQSNTSLYWWDGNAKEILQLAEQVNPLSTQKNVSNYLNKREENTKPSVVYDSKYKEMLFSVVNGEILAYSEIIGRFTSVYKFMPIFGTQVFDSTIVSSDNDLYYLNKQEEDGKSKLFDNADAKPLVLYVINKDSQYNKVYDISTFGGRFYGGEEGLDNLTFTFHTPLKQTSTDTGRHFITNREYDFRLAIPRNANSAYGDRMRGKTMQCELSSNSNSTDFSLQYIITKYRMSWS